MLAFLQAFLGVAVSCIISFIFVLLQLRILVIDYSFDYSDDKSNFKKLGHLLFLCPPLMCSASFHCFCLSILLSFLFFTCPVFAFLFHSFLPSFLVSFLSSLFLAFFLFPLLFLHSFSLFAASIFKMVVNLNIFYFLLNIIFKYHNLPK